MLKPFKCECRLLTADEYYGIPGKNEVFFIRILITPFLDPLTGEKSSIEKTSILPICPTLEMSSPSEMQFLNNLSAKNKDMAERLIQAVTRAGKQPIITEVDKETLPNNVTKTFICNTRAYMKYIVNPRIQNGNLVENICKLNESIFNDMRNHTGSLTSNNTNSIFLSNKNAAPRGEKRRDANDEKPANKKLNSSKGPSSKK